MLNNLPVVVILPVYNSENQIKEAGEKIVRILKKLIDSSVISDLSYLLLVDNNSTDNSWYEAGKIVAKNPRVAHAVKLRKKTKTSAILKNAAYCKNIIVDLKNYDKIEQYILNFKESLIVDKFHFIKDIFKTSNYSVIDELP